MAILPWRAPRTLRNGHLHRDAVRARSAMAINQAERSAICQLERQQVRWAKRARIVTAGLRGSHSRREMRSREAIKRIQQEAGRGMLQSAIWSPWTYLCEPSV